MEPLTLSSMFFLKSMAIYFYLFKTRLGKQMGICSTGLLFILFNLLINIKSTTESKTHTFGKTKVSLGNFSGSVGATFLNEG